MYRWETPADFRPRRNLRPTEAAYIIARHPEGEIRTVKANWWCQWDGAAEFKADFPAFNIRVEGMDRKKLWPPLLKAGKRCVFPIDAFYEWPVKGKGLPPVKIVTADREPYGIAGLWSTWYENGEPRYSFATFTVPPNDFMVPIHPKAMPVILDSPDTQKRWLEEGDRDLLVPYARDLAAEQMTEALEKLYPEENLSPRAKETNESSAGAHSEQGTLF